LELLLPSFVSSVGAFGFAFSDDCAIGSVIFKSRQKYQEQSDGQRNKYARFKKIIALCSIACGFNDQSISQNI
jgi:hypothetical protein